MGPPVIDGTAETVGNCDADGRKLGDTDDEGIDDGTCEGAALEVGD